MFHFCTNIHTYKFSQIKILDKNELFCVCSKMEQKKVEVEKSKNCVKANAGLVAKPVAIVAPFIDPHFSPKNPYGEFSPTVTRRWKRPPTLVRREYLPILRNIGTVFLSGKEVPICPVEAVPRADSPMELETSPIPSGGAGPTLETLSLRRTLQRLWRRYSI